MVKTGRTSIKGKSRVGKHYERQNYSIALKLAVLSYWDDCKNVDLTLNKFWPRDEAKQTKRKLLYQWKENKLKMMNTKSSHHQFCKIRPTKISCILPIELEMYLASWVRSLRSVGIPVSNTIII